MDPKTQALVDEVMLKSALAQSLAGTPTAAARAAIAPLVSPECLGAFDATTAAVASKISAVQAPVMAMVSPAPIVAEIVAPAPPVFASRATHVGVSVAASLGATLGAIAVTHWWTPLLGVLAALRRALGGP